MNQFSNTSQDNWKPNSLHSSRPANQHGQPPFPPCKDADQSKRSCEKCKGSHILATCPEYQKCAPDQRYDIVSKNNLCSNCLSNKHFKQSCPSTKRCQTCKGYHHTTLHDPSKQVKRPTAAFSTSNPNQPKQNLASPQTQPSFQQNQNKSTDTVSSTKSQQTRYGQSFSGKRQSQQQNIQRAHLSASNPTQNFSINRNTIPPPEWYEQLQIIPVSFVKGSKVFDTYALIDPGSQFTFLLDKFTSFLELPCEAQASTTLQYLNTEHEMPLSKISETVTVTPYDKISQHFSIARAYSTPCLNVSHANVLELNQLCDTFKELSHIYFPDIANGAIGALLGVNTFHFTYPVEVIQGSKKRPFGVKTKLGWTLAGEYELSPKTMNSNKPPRQPFIYHVCRKDTEEEPLDELVQRFWKIEAEGTLPEQNEDSSLDQLAVQTMENSICHNGERYQIGPPWKPVKKLQNNYFSAVSQLKSLQKRLQNDPGLNQKYNQTLQTDLDKNFVKPVEMQAPPPESIWYLPHHSVTNPNKPGKVRRVANAASKFRGESLNSNLLTGPDLLNNLVGVLLRFREHPVAVLSDIEGMFMQIAVRQEDQSTLRFLWMIDNSIRQFQFTILIFGATCSPFCAIYVLNKCAEDNKIEFPAALNAIKHHFYMDDYIQSLPTTSEAKEVISQTTRCLKNGGFKLTKFVSNQPDSAKRTLLLILGSRRLSFDTFLTIMVETESILNSRPLTNVAEQPYNEEP
ncbi:uncharacterized protein LOC142351729 [Convolutriloba macropyga]|uniref:uncharacterized protein LOC142351729 n=1 Tax=Convolutriloba macropyga TaxID=536237 RepID=UPI003F526814